MERRASIRPSATWIRVASAVAGIAAIGLVIHWVGGEKVLDTLFAALPYLPLVAALEGLRIPLEALVTLVLIGGRAKLPLASLLRMHLYWYGITIAAPGGRPVAETWKAAMLAPRVGSHHAVLIAIAAMLTSFVADAIIACSACVCAFVVLGAVPLTWAICTVAAGSSLAAIGMSVVLRSDVGCRLASRLPWVGHKVPAFVGVARRHRLLKARALAASVLARTCQIVMFACLLHITGLGASIDRAILLQALNMVGAVIGDLVPAQLGTTDATFALASGTLRLDAAALAAIAILYHAAQFCWVLLAGACALVDQTLASLGRAELD